MFSLANFLKTLPVMLWGMIGIIAVTAIIILVIFILNKVTSNSENNKQ